MKDDESHHDEEDDEELVREAIRSAKKIEEFSKNNLDCSYQTLMDIGKRVLQLRDQTLKERASAGKRSSHTRIPSVIDFLELYQ